MNFQDYKKTSDALKKITQFSPKKVVKKPKDISFLRKLGLEKPKLSPYQPKKESSLKFLKKYDKKTPQFTEVTQIIQKDISDELKDKIDFVLNRKEEIDYEEIAKYVLEYIKNVKGNDRLDITNIRNHEQLLQRKNNNFDMDDQRWHGGGSSGSSSTGYQAASGVVNGINTIFTFVTAPNVVTVDGVSIQKVSNDGTINWTGSQVITLAVAPNITIFATA